MLLVRYMIECLLKELVPELNVQWGRSNVGLARVEDAWIKCNLL